MSTSLTVLSNKDLLTQARNVIANPEDWFGGGSLNKLRRPDHPAGRCCAVMAINKIIFGNIVMNVTTLNVTTPEDWKSYHERLGTMLPVCFGMNTGELVAFNDTHDHHEVIELFDKAIALASGEPYVSNSDQQ